MTTDGERIVRVEEQIKALSASVERMRVKTDIILAKIEALSLFRAQALSVAGVVGAVVSFTVTWAVNRLLPITILTLLLAGCGTILDSQLIPAGVPVVIPPIICEAVAEWWDETGDGNPDYMIHRPEAGCLKKFRGKPQPTPPPPDRRAF